MTHEEFVEKLQIAHGNEYILLDKYEKNTDKLRFLHTKCGNIITKIAAKMINKHAEGCYYCNGKNHWKTTESFQEELNRKYPGKYVVLTDYVRARDKLLVHNNECGHEYMISPDNLLRGKGCPYEGLRNSKYVRTVEKFLKENEIDYQKEKIFDDCKNERYLPFDFYLPKYNTCIEVDGEFHYFETNFKNKNNLLEKVNFRDNIKTNYCKDNDIKLIRLPYFEFENFIPILKKELYVNTEVN